MRAAVRTARTARDSVRQCAAVVIIIVILQPPCCATIIIITHGSSTDLRVVYGRVMYGSAGGLRIYGWVSGGLLVIPAAAMEYQFER